MFAEGVHTKEDDDEQTRHGSPAIATSLFSSLASALAPEGSQPSLHTSSLHSLTAPWPTRKLCGRWLAVRRLQSGLSAATVANLAGVDAATLQLLELGLLSDQVFDDARWEALALLVANTAQLDADLVRHVVHVATGVAQLSPALLEQVAAEVRPLHPPCDE